MQVLGVNITDKHMPQHFEIYLYQAGLKRGLLKQDTSYSAIWTGMVVMGRATVKVVPCPSLLETLMRPPCFATIPWETLRPRPVPFPLPFVVKNGSKIEDRMCSGMPAPESITFTAT